MHKEKSTITYISDSMFDAKNFINSLSPKIVRQRFSDVREWTPDHVELIAINGKIVAMADCLITDPSEGEKGATAGLLAMKGFGGHAITALLRLKKRVQIKYWFSTLRKPTDSTVSISRRFFDETYDQGTWEIANQLAKTFGSQPFLRPIPLFASRSSLQGFGIPPLVELDEGSVSQILHTAANPGTVLLSTPNGNELPLPFLMAMAFDLLNAPMQLRQDVTRTFILPFLAMTGRAPSPWIVDKIVDKKAFGTFISRLKEADKAASHAKGIFSEKYIENFNPIETISEAMGNFNKPTQQLR